MHACAVAVTAVVALPFAGAALPESAVADVPDQRAAPVVHVVTIKGMQFDPAELVVERGSEVVWVNEDLVPHTATARAFDSGNIPAGASWAHVASQAGDHPYVCAFHPTMKGRLIVR